MNIDWSHKQFTELTPSELYQILRLRSEVFVVEQNCVFLDMDNVDQESFHLMGWLDNSLVAYARIVPPGKVYAEPSIGRVVTSPSVRKRGKGKKLMEEAIKFTERLYGDTTIKIGAQLYLKHFYEAFGFRQASNVYLEDGIEHVYMHRDALT